MTVVRDAATVIVLRDRAHSPKVLMGRRGSKAAFMPDKMVFPGGAVDPGDAEVPLRGLPERICLERLAEGCDPTISGALAAAAVRELWEETGLILGTPGDWPDAPPDWARFAATGHRPSASGMRFVFRAITPPGRTRRFDARFFLLDAEQLSSDPDDFTHAEDELSALSWVPLDETEKLDLPFITEVVLAEVASRIDDPAPPPSVPFFRNSDEESHFLRLGRRGPLP
ncbi:8-oxo-dGTP pyrophosphatase MutT, NUDIX family [Poseidonocella pacifica]|uniref:8-oxo-dGTP pyrophosphatase MutT, NUDIX family n=1 Tax=Poseidonocella pacifica TaxID=871651 RepID=A0A1I0Y4M9_9RHOB|nr:NUDIX hydrolase [Poseidonocella pacifica]SFB08114.1 8-oxo-dGTP pyrophosphatase MutT, NUDIX family [Poseidonocella pacifica]